MQQILDQAHVIIGVCFSKLYPRTTKDLVIREGGAKVQSNTKEEDNEDTRDDFGEKLILSL